MKKQILKPQKIGGEDFAVFFNDERVYVGTLWECKEYVYNNEMHYKAKHYAESGVNLDPKNIKKIQLQLWTICTIIIYKNGNFWWQYGGPMPATPMNEDEKFRIDMACLQYIDFLNTSFFQHDNVRFFSAITKDIE